MKNTFLALVSIVTFSLQAQEADVNKTIDTFFEGLHTSDTLKIRSVASEKMLLQTIHEKAKTSKVDTDNLKEFYTSIASIPKDLKIEERLLSRKIQIDGTMAHAWTPYEFYINGKLSHSGVNSFMLHKEDDGKWKIIYIVDTRRGPQSPKGK